MAERLSAVRETHLRLGTKDILARLNSLLIYKNERELSVWPRHLIDQQYSIAQQR